MSNACYVCSVKTTPRHWGDTTSFWKVFKVAWVTFFVLEKTNSLFKICFFTLVPTESPAETWAVVGCEMWTMRRKWWTLWSKKLPRRRKGKEKSNFSRFFVLLHHVISLFHYLWFLHKFQGLEISIYSWKSAFNQVWSFTLSFTITLLNSLIWTTSWFK